MRKRKGLIEILVWNAVLIVVVTVLVIPGTTGPHRPAQERNACASLKTPATAEFDFKANDRDGNKVADYWTGDVAGLYCMTSAATPGNKDCSLKMIEPTIAGADSAPLPAGAAGGEYAAIPDFMNQEPKSGHWYFALASDAAEGEAYARDTGGTPKMGPVHNMSRFGFMTYPDEHGSGGRYVFIVNEANTVYRREPGSPVKPSAFTPPGAVTAPGFPNWPNAADLKANWVPLE